LKFSFLKIIIGLNDIRVGVKTPCSLIRLIDFEIELKEEFEEFEGDESK
jgi:hypothetical protein